MDTAHDCVSFQVFHASWRQLPRLASMPEGDELKAAQQQLQDAMKAHSAAQQNNAHKPAGISTEPVKIKVRVSLDEVSLRVTCSNKVMDRKLVDACVVPFLGAYNKRVETHKQCELEDLISIKINGELIGRDDLNAEARYILGRASARAVDNGKTTDGEQDDITMELGTRATHERDWHEKGRPVESGSSL